MKKKQPDKPNVAALDADYKIDTSKPCPLGKGTLHTCGLRREGSMFPFCGRPGDIGERRCPQVIVEFKMFSADQVKKEDSDPED